MGVHDPGLRAGDPAGEDVPEGVGVSEPWTLVLDRVLQSVVEPVQRLPPPLPVQQLLQECGVVRAVDGLHLNLVYEVDLQPHAHPHTIRDSRTSAAERSISAAAPALSDWSPRKTSMAAAVCWSGWILCMALVGMGGSLSQLV